MMIRKDRGSRNSYDRVEDDVVPAESVFVVGEQEVDHKADNLTRREVLTRIFVQGLVKYPDQLLPCLGDRISQE